MPKRIMKGLFNFLMAQCITGAIRHNIIKSRTYHNGPSIGESAMSSTNENPQKQLRKVLMSIWAFSYIGKNLMNNGCNCVSNMRKPMKFQNR